MSHAQHDRCCDVAPSSVQPQSVTNLRYWWGRRVRIAMSRASIIDFGLRFEDVSCARLLVGVFLGCHPIDFQRSGSRK